MTTKLRIVGALTPVLGIALLAAAAWYLPSASLGPGRGLAWQLGYVGGHPFGASDAGTATVPIEIEHPGCVSDDGDSWFNVTVAYTPISVTIQVRMTPEAAAKCPPPPAGVLPMVGDYLMGILYTVNLQEPLAGRALFDGFTFPAAARPYR